MNEPTRTIFIDNVKEGNGQTVITVYKKINQQYLGYINWSPEQGNWGFVPANRTGYEYCLMEILLKIHELDQKEIKIN